MKLHYLFFSYLKIGVFKKYFDGKRRHSKWQEHILTSDASWAKTSDVISVFTTEHLTHFTVHILQLVEGLFRLNMAERD